MKWFVGLLVLINAGLFAYFNLNQILPNTPQIKWAEINPEKIKVLSPEQIEALPKKVVEPPATPEPVMQSCYEWGVFSAASLANAQSAIAQLSLQASVKEYPLHQAKRFWVYKPPLKTLQEAQEKKVELQALGVEELFVVQDQKWKNAISFGVFEDEQLATKLLNELKEKGVKGVVKSLRNQGDEHSSLSFTNLTEAEITELKKLKAEFPSANLKEVACHESALKLMGITYLNSKYHSDQM